MYELVFIFIYAIVLTTALRNVTGEGLNFLPALLFSALAAIGATLIVGTAASYGLFALMVGVFVAWAVLTLAIFRVLSVPPKKAGTVAAVCTAFQFVFTYVTL